MPVLSDTLINARRMAAEFSVVIKLSVCVVDGFAQSILRIELQLIESD